MRLCSTKSKAVSVPCPSKANHARPPWSLRSGPLFRLIARTTVHRWRSKSADEDLLAQPARLVATRAPVRAVRRLRRITAPHPSGLIHSAHTLRQATSVVALTCRGLGAHAETAAAEHSGINVNDAPIELIALTDDEGRMSARRDGEPSFTGVEDVAEAIMSALARGVDLVVPADLFDEIRDSFPPDLPPYIKVR